MWVSMPRGTTAQDRDRRTSAHPDPVPVPAPDRAVPRSRDTDLADPPVRCSAGSPPMPRLAPLRLVRLDRFERRDPLAGGGFELLLQRRPVVGDELGLVTRAGDLDVEATSAW